MLTFVEERVPEGLLGRAAFVSDDHSHADDVVIEPRRVRNFNAHASLCFAAAAAAAAAAAVAAAAASAAGLTEFED